MLGGVPLLVSALFVLGMARGYWLIEAAGPSKRFVLWFPTCTPSLSPVAWLLFCRARLADIAGSCLPSVRRDVTAPGVLAVVSLEDGTDQWSLKLLCSAAQSLVPAAEVAAEPRTAARNLETSLFHGPRLGFGK